MDNTVTGSAAEGAMMDTADWQARAGHIREVLAGASDTAVAAALGTFLFSDDAGKTWTYNGATWMSWDGSQWSEGKAPSSLRLQPYLQDVSGEPAAAEPVAAETAMAAAVETKEPEMVADAMPAVVTADMPAASVADEKVADDGKDEDDDAVAAASPVELPAMADSYPMAEVATPAEPDITRADMDAKDEMSAAADMGAEEPKTSELAADTAEATWTGSASATADKPTTDATTSMSSEPAASTPAATSQTSSATPATAAATPAATAAAFKATHTVPPAGMGAWVRPDPSVRPEYQLAPRTELQVVEMLSSGWAHVAGSNGWTGWVDGRQLIAIVVQPAMATPASAWPPSQPAAQPAAQPAQPWQQPAQQAQPSWQQPQQQQPAWQQPAQQAQPAQPQWQAQQPGQQAQPAQPSWQQPAQQPQPTQAAQPAQQAFRATHGVPPMGMPAWAQPNPALPPVAQLAPGTQLMLAEQSQSGWARVVASNGWSGWVDGRMLVPYQR